MSVEFVLLVLVSLNLLLTLSLSRQLRVAQKEAHSAKVYAGDARAFLRKMLMEQGFDVDGWARKIE